MTYPSVNGRPSGDSGPGRMVLGPAGWQPVLGAGSTPGVDLSGVPTPQLVDMFVAGREPSATNAARELAARFVRTWGPAALEGK